MKKLFAVLLVLVMILSLSACSKDETATDNTTADNGQQVVETAGSIEGMTVAFIPKLTGNSFFEAANDGAQKYAEQWGIEVKYMGSATASVTDQLEVIQQAIDAGVDAIAISSVDAKALDEKLKEAQDMGIVVRNNFV